MSTHILSLSSNGVIKPETFDPSLCQMTTPLAVIVSDQGGVVEAETPQAKLSPSHKLALTGSQCAVCGDGAVGPLGFRKHYGVICCEACKCFFRRTVQMSRDYKCRFGGKCAIGRTAVNLKQVCQACRFNQCQRAGMKIESVKKFPRKMRDDSAKKVNKKQTRSQREKQMSTDTSNDIDPKYSQSVESPQSIKSESDIEELSTLKFNVTSPETMRMLENANVRQLFNYNDSLENIHRDSGGSPAGTRSTNGGSTENLSVVKPMLGSTSSIMTIAASVGKSVTVETSPSTATDNLTQYSDNNEAATYFFPPNVNWSMRKGAEHLSMPGSGHTPFAIPTSPTKRPRIDSSGSAIDMMSHHSSPSYGSHSAPPTPLPHHTHSQPSSRVNSPDPGMSSVYTTHNNTPFVTPTHSPLPSPTSHPTNFMSSSQVHFPSSFHSQPGSAGGIVVPSSTNNLPSHQFTSSPSGVSQLTLPGFSSSNSLLTLQQTASGNTILLPNTQLPFGMAPLFPVVQFSQFPPSLGEQQRLQSRLAHVQHGGGGTGGGVGGYGVLHGQSGKSPFRIIPIPSINKTQPPEEPECAEVSAICREAEGLGCGDGMLSAPASARSSPVPNKPKSSASLPEANVEEVLESLRLRIRSMFKWAKSEVAGFDDLSPLDQKALLRKTVAELVMLGFARGSIAYDNVLLLGSTGAVLMPSNVNAGIASVASVTLEKLVVPLKVLNISDKELRLLREVVLFNPEANGLRNREIVRQYRKRKHIELMEYTEKHSEDPGRFGDLMCLLTPLFEVGLEVTEQLRLEQFVHEGEARIDALLLMSMISGAEEMPTESTVDQ